LQKILKYIHKFEVEIVDLKAFIDGELTISGGSLFQSEIDREKNDSFLNEDLVEGI